MKNSKTSVNKNRPLNEQLHKIAGRISTVSPISSDQIRYDPEYPSNKCHHNVKAKVEKNGGKLIRGWIVIANGGIAHCIDHSIWQSPKGEYVNITTILDITFPDYYVFVPANDEFARGARDFTFALTNNRRLKKTVNRIRRSDWEMRQAERHGYCIKDLVKARGRGVNYK